MSYRIIGILMQDALSHTQHCKNTTLIYSNIYTYTYNDTCSPAEVICTTEDQVNENLSLYIGSML